MRNRDYLCLFRSKFDVMLKLSDAGLREMNQAFFDFLEEREPTFKDAQAQALWWAWSLEFQSQEKQAKDFSEIQREKGKRGGLKSASLRQANQATASFASNVQASNSSASNFQAESSKSSLTDTVTVTDTDTNNIKEKNIIKKENEPTREEILEIAKDPSVSISEDEANHFYDHYTAQGWLRSNGQPIENTKQALFAMLRIWKRNSGNFNLTQSPLPQTIDVQSLERAYEWLNGHYIGDYDTDPQTDEEIKQWAEQNNIYDRLRNKNDKLYKHVFKL